MNNFYGNVRKRLIARGYWLEEKPSKTSHSKYIVCVNPMYPGRRPISIRISKHKKNSHKGHVPENREHIPWDIYSKRRLDAFYIWLETEYEN